MTCIIAVALLGLHHHLMFANCLVACDGIVISHGDPDYQCKPKNTPKGEDM